MSTATEIAERLDGKRTGDGWICRCPAHDDQNPSLSVSEAGGKVLVKCHRGCEQGAVIAALRDLGLWSSGPNGKGGGSGSGRREVCRYDYTDAEGNLLYQVVRFEPKDFRQFDAVRKVWNLKEVDRVPYRLSEVLHAIEDGKGIFVVEGERDVDSLRKLGLSATCNPGGCGSAGLWRSFAKKFFSARTRVYMVADADPPGQQLMDAAAAQLVAAGCEVKRIDLGYSITPNHGKDISDWLAEGHTQEELIGLATTAPVWAAAANGAETHKRKHAEQPETEDGGEQETADGAEPSEDIPPKQGTAKKSRGPSASTILLQKIFETDALLFHEGDETYCSFTIGEHTETGPLRSRPFRRHLSRLFYETMKSAPSAKAIEEALGVLDAIARHDGPDIPVYSRYAPDGSGGIYVDLGDDEWISIHVTPAGYAPEKSPCKFIRPDGQKALPSPVAGGSIEELRNFWNVGTDAKFRLAVVFTLQAMRPAGPYAGEEVDGPAGSGKTSFVEIQKAIIDPNIAPIRSSPRTEVDLVIAARGSQCPCLGNLSRLSSDQSDQLCRLSDGAGLGKRTLWTDWGESIACVQRPFILNGINPVAHSGDLLDRLFRITLKAIPEDLRKTPEECKAAWSEAYPRILGAVYNLMARTLAELPKVERPGMLPRMASVALFGIAVERAAGWPEGSFMDAYRENIRAADESALESSPVFEIMVKRIEGQWKGTASELLFMLEEHESRCDLEARLSKSCTCGMTKVMHDHGWPRNARSLSAAIRRLLPNAERVGWKFTFSEEGKSKVKTITIERGTDEIPF